MRQKWPFVQLPNPIPMPLNGVFKPCGVTRGSPTIRSHVSSGLIRISSVGRFIPTYNWPRNVAKLKPFGERTRGSSWYPPLVTTGCHTYGGGPLASVLNTP